jgi:hypothetical protein
MTSIRTAPAAAGIRISHARRLATWIGTRQQAVSDRVHATGDAHARTQGWTVTASTGRFGFGARTYRDPRFDSRRNHAGPGSPARLAEPSRTPQYQERATR